jgi:NitT/TauT family transport system permease protein
VPVSDEPLTAPAPAGPGLDEVVRQRRRRGRRRTLENVLAPLVVGAVFVGVWYFISYVVLEPSRRFLLRPPHEVVATGFLDWDTLSEMLTALWSTAKVAAYGLAISVVLGVLIAVLMSQARLIERGLWPYLVTLQAVPILALVPLISFWVGTGHTARVVVCVVISFFPMVVNTLFGLQSVDRGAHDLFTLHRASRTVRLRKLMVPSALPAIFAGLRIAAGLSVIGAIVGDFFFGRGEIGIGQLMQRYFQRIRGEELIAAVILSSMLGVAVFWFFTWLQNRVIGKWYDPLDGIGT